MDFTKRAEEDELMDDLSRPRNEFALAYRELEIINRRLGGIRAIERFLPSIPNALILDVASGACDVSEALLLRRNCRIVALDRNLYGLRLAKRSIAVAADALDPPFRDGTFDVVMASLFFHHLSNDDCVRVLRHMWRLTRRCLLVNDLHRHRLAYASIRILTALFSRSAMVRHDGPVSVRRAFRPAELLELAAAAGVPARVERSFPYRVVLIAERA
jgi:ubiquinone/menaquinone biosynthesis C-methylase UbiE